MSEHVQGKWCEDLRCARCYHASAWQESELSACRAAIPDTPEFDFLVGKTLPECVEAMVEQVREHSKSWPSERALAALRELVRLKDLHDKIEDHDNIETPETREWRYEYRNRKPVAWREARAVLAECHKPNSSEAA